MSPLLEMPQGSAPQEKHTYAKKKSVFLPLALLILCLGISVFFIYQGRLISTQNSISAVLVPVPSPLSVAYTEILTNHGMLVSQGSPLARLDLSGFAQHLPHAQALVQGLPQAQRKDTNQAQLIESIQSDEASMVNRIALARQEEQAKRTLMEKLSVEHAKALLHMRSAQESALARAQATERKIREQLEQAKAAYEFASRTRSAIESVLQQLRAQRRSQMPVTVNQNIPAITEQLLAPVEGYVVGNPPAAGQVFQKGSPVFMLLPTKNTQLKALVHLPQEDARKLNMDTPSYIKVQNTLLQASVQQIAHNGAVSVVSLLLQVEGEDFEDLMQATQEKETRSIFWPQAWLQNFLPEFVIRILSFI